MKRTHRLVVGLFLLGACSDDEGETLGTYLDESQMHTDELRSEIEAHYEDARIAESLVQLQELEEQHEEETRMHLDELERNRETMMHCGAQEEHMSALDDMHENCVGEMQRHRDRVRDCSTLEEAMQEEERHRHGMMADLDGMTQTMHGMGKHHHSMCDVPDLN